MHSIIFAVLMPLIEINPPGIKAFSLTTPVLKEQTLNMATLLISNDGVDVGFGRGDII